MRIGKKLIKFSQRTTKMDSENRKNNELSDYLLPKKIFQTTIKKNLKK
jgi:hypothetical protein